MSENKNKLTTRKLVFCAMALALATVISTVIKLPSLPAGGSITLFSMLVICLIGYWYGPVIGLITALAYGVLQFVTGPYVVHPVQVLLDYPLAFGALGLSGFFWQKKNGLIKGYVVGVLGRLLMHEISGYLFYTEYVPGNSGATLSSIWASIVECAKTIMDWVSANLPVFWASTAYNLSYILPELILTLILLCLPQIRNMLKRLKALANQA